MSFMDWPDESRPFDVCAINGGGFAVVCNLEDTPLYCGKDGLWTRSPHTVNRMSKRAAHRVCSNLTTEHNQYRDGPGRFWCRMAERARRVRFWMDLKREQRKQRRARL